MQTYAFPHNVRSAKLSNVSIHKANPFVYIRKPLPVFAEMCGIQATLEGYYFHWEKMMAKLQQDYGVEFVNITVSTRDKDVVDSWVGQQQADLLEHVEHMLNDGYKISLSLDQKNDCYIAAVTGSNEQRWNPKKCMTSRASSFEEALWLCLYKHMVLCDSGSWGDGSSRNQAYG